MDWLLHFMFRRAERYPIPWHREIAIDEGLRVPLIRSLQRIQLGLQGDGRCLLREAARLGDISYTAALTLLVEEEQEHAHLLGRVLDGLGGTRLQSHWSHMLFLAFRRPLGLYHELLVLLVAEMIGSRYYRMLHDTLDDPLLRAVFRRTYRSEEGHIAFHAEALRRVFAPLPPAGRAFLRVSWSVGFAAAFLVLVWDHRSLLEAVGVTPRRFWNECHELFEEVGGAVFGGVSGAVRLV